MPKVVRGASLVVLALTGPAVPALAGFASVTGDCGSAGLASTPPFRGATCIVLCGPTTSASFCLAAGDDPSPIVAARGPVCTAVESLVVKVVGEDVTVGDLAAHVASVSGWKALLELGLSDVVLVPGEWRASRSELAHGMHFAAADQQVRLSLDPHARAFTLERLP